MNEAIKLTILIQKPQKRKSIAMLKGNPFQAAARGGKRQREIITSTGVFSEGERGELRASAFQAYYL